MRKLSVIILIILSHFLNAQPPSKFYTTFGGDGDDIGYSGKPTLDGQYIVAGSSSSYGTNGNTDAYLVKVDSMGSPIWQKFYGGLGNEVGKSVIQLQDSGYVIAGFTNSFGAGGYDAYLLKTDKSGNLLWQRTFGGTDWDFANDLVLGSDGNIFVVGYTTSFGNGKKDGFILKYDLQGNLLLQKFIGGAENEELKSIIKTNDNFLATVGYTESRGEINGDGYFLKLDLNGDTIFTRTFGGPYKDYASDLVQKDFNQNYDYIMCGAKTYTPNGKTHSYMYRLSSNGIFVLDSSRYHSTGDEHYESIANSSKVSGLTGFLKSIPVPDFGIQGNIMVQNPIGYEYAINSFGGNLDEEFFSIEGTIDGGYVMIGSTMSFGSQGLDVFLVKIDDAVVITYESVVGLKQIQADENPTISYQNNRLIEINFTENDTQNLVTIFDMNGIICRKLIINEKKISLNLYDLKEGIYIVKIKNSSGRLFYKKIIIR